MDEQNTGEYQEAAAPLDEALADSHDQAQEVQSERSVPLDALQAERAARQRLEEENRMFRENMQLFMQQQQQQQHQQQQPEQPKYSRDDVVTFGELEEFTNRIQQQYTAKLTEIDMQMKYPDYKTVISQHLPKVLKENPGLANSLRATNDYELAYHLAKNSESYKTENHKTKRNQTAERIVQNSEQAGSLSAVGHAAPLSEAQRYKTMSDEEFRQLANRNRGVF